MADMIKILKRKITKKLIIYLTVFNFILLSLTTNCNWRVKRRHELESRIMATISMLSSIASMILSILRNDKLMITLLFLQTFAIPLGFVLGYSGDVFLFITAII